MGFFTKPIGPVFLKSDTRETEYVNKLKELLEQCPDEIKEEIGKQITIAERGIKGEEQIEFQLKNSGMDMYILRDIYLEYGKLSAQIDYMIVTRKRVYIIECKNWIGNIEINNNGDFIRTYQLKGRNIREGSDSPITQNVRHLQVVKELRKANKRNFIAKKRFENYFDNSYKSIIVLTNPKTILNVRYAKKEVKEQVIRVDQLIQKIKDMDKSVKGEISEKEMKEVAEFFLDKNRPNKVNYMAKYETLIEKKEAAERVRRAEEETKEQLKMNLKAFRMEQSRQEKIKPYIIFNNAQMEDLIDKKPKNKEELCQISGFGKVRTEKYGEAILEILNKE